MSPGIVVRLALAAVAACWISGAAAQNEQDSPASALPAPFQQTVSDIESLQARIEDAPLARRDALRYRIDQLGLQLHARFASQSRDGALSPEARRAASDWLIAFGLERVEALETRIREALDTLEPLSSEPAAIVGRAFVHDLQMTRLDQVGALIDLMGPTGPGLPDPALQRVRETVQMSAQRLHGEIRLDAQTLRDLRGRVGADPRNADLATALGILERGQARNLELMDRLVGMLRELGLPTESHNSLVVQQRGVIGVEIFDRRVFADLVIERLRDAKRALLGSGPDWLFRIVVLVVILFLAWVAAGIVRRRTRRMLARESVRLSRLLKDTIVSLAFGLTLLIGLIIALSALGVSLGPMLAGLGVAGIIVGFAIQDSLANLAAGWMILLYRPYDVDDHVRVAGGEGLVRRMNLLATTIATFDNQVLVIPNRKIWGDTIVNLTATEARRIDIRVSCAYESDLDEVERILWEVLGEDDRVLDDPEPMIHIEEMADSAIVMMAKPWVRTDDYWQAMRDLKKRIKQRFDEKGIRIPFPQMDVHVHGLPGGSGGSGKSS